ncbi:60S ribosomal protein L2 [Spraguea lophii 42_110]|uniref:60S ribosomal protein L20 n=1 Tax=Spraguea lophii (strain 42_110) TaxID=1358809 RepID=S7WAG4_SPRLO|nr:Chain LS0, 60S ribosomal protein L20 [Spraguea lophii 42_110]7QJH_KS0 Chain KS0, 60S ribosomal protein L20 [Spraguea lophii 42_110]7QJH_LS0 Chain LS0, 60S ribosomal protein L20 [Spraguea lophii 42_110]8BR3_LS0 Chain LS0, 60S ribosomal protein L20 [Spraguea lophii 42_110]8P5D_LS0 Chain LS0, 60S ribosomal protein L20 [Spraguea lophii 42_110]8P60_KS0 Chain KS0, 60S ribosomal protein L20 [Spraguea lophii 42_110]8P60_LS0 Chain LS0, 60S ribosomal protein L20 [Spraguea lophii 42_110]EPR78722.1 6
MAINEYKVYGIKIDDNGVVGDEVYAHIVFATNELLAKSSFNKILKKQKKIKPKNTKVIKVEEIKEDNKDLDVKNYGIDYYYKSKRCDHKGYKEFRGVSRCHAVDKLLCDIGGRHSVKRNLIFIMKVKELTVDEIKKDKIKIFAMEDVEYPAYRNVLRSNKLFVSENEKLFN